LFHISCHVPVNIYSLSHLCSHTQYSSLFPYSTLFRSLLRAAGRLRRQQRGSQLQAAARYVDLWVPAGDLVADLGMATPPCYWALDRKSTRLNSSHVSISYAVFCL